MPCGPIYKINESFADPQVQHSKMAQPVKSPVLGDLTILGHPVSWGDTRNPIRTPAPELGQDNEDDPHVDRLYEGPDRRSRAARRDLNGGSYRSACVTRCT